VTTALEQYQRERAVASLRRLKEAGPQTDEQLWYWIWYVLGFHIAWRAVCPEHTAPFQFLADVYFIRVSSAAVHGARGSGKTRDLSILHLLHHHYRDSFQTSHVGAIMRQANLNYGYLKEYFRDPHFRRALAQDPLMSETRWKNGSRLEVLPGTIGATSGPHPNFAVADEFDLMAWDVYQQFVGMPMSSDRYPAQTLYASAMVTSFGPMNRLLTEAPSRGIKVYVSCLLDVMEPCATCEDAERVKRGVETKPYDCLLWEDCQGRVRQATGHIKKVDAINRRLQSDNDTWNVQSLCRTASRKGLVYENWLDAPGDPDSNVTEEAEYNPELPVAWAVDDGYSPDPLVVLAVQEMGNGDVHVFNELYTNMTLYEEVMRWLSGKRELDAAERETGIWYWQETVWDEGRKAELTGQAKAYRKPGVCYAGVTDKQLQSYIRQLGVPVRAPTKTGVIDGVKEVRRLIRDAQGHRGLLVHPRCRWLRRDMGQYHRKQVASGVYAEEPADNTGRSNPDDGADCIRVLAASRLESRGQRIKAV
jgi:hypothetical protein